MRRIRTLAIAFLLLNGSAIPAGQVGSSLGEKVVAYCQEHNGQQIGDGQCAVLAAHALHAAGARGMGRDHPNKGDYTWGRFALVVEEQADGVKSETGAFKEIQPGDIIQLRDVKFVHHKGRAILTSFYGHHTAVVEKIEEDPTIVHVFQQNSGGHKYITTATFRLNELKKGWMRFYHPEPRRKAA
jgi:hypothetical protein